MAKINSFEDIQAWQKARELNKEIYKVSNGGAFSKDYGLRDQIRRASVSIVSNIAEGFERNGSKEFRQFLSISKGSAGEVRAQLYVAYDLDYITKEEFEKLNSLVFDTSRMISGFINYLRDSELKGAKFN
ncbi:MAG: four helix bundle protein [Bacteroidetes bacterium]|nr:four helix bundle protein [Bacteroidota bacterium]